MDRLGKFAGTVGSGKRMLFIPTVYSEHGGSLPRTDPRAKTDFIGQHVKCGWSESDALARYELWVARAIDTNPELDKSSHETRASAAIVRSRKQAGCQ